MTENESNGAEATPKVFISYSWTSQAHRETVRSWAERLIGDGVEVIMDIYDLKEGQNKYAFMERMVTDDTVSHVLIFSDQRYAEKADARDAGVGVESLIISQEIYDKVDQTKFIPIVCEFSEDGKAHLPVFLKSAIWIDFSSDEKANSSWEQLIRVLYGKPLYQKPELGRAPLYLVEERGAASSPMHVKYANFKSALLQGRKGLAHYREDFLTSCLDYVDALRVRSTPETSDIGRKVIDDCGKLVIARDSLADWVLFESQNGPTEEFMEALIEMLEQVLEMKSRPETVTAWNETWFEAHRLFAYELFLYVIASLLKTRRLSFVRRVLSSNFLDKSRESAESGMFRRFDAFYCFSEILNEALESESKRYLAPAAELVRRQAQRKDVPFESIIEADFVILLMACISDVRRWWYPQTALYKPRGKPVLLFLRATERRHFERLSEITGLTDADVLRQKVRSGFERLEVERWQDFRFSESLWESMNMDKLNTIS